MASSFINPFTQSPLRQVPPFPFSNKPPSVSFRSPNLTASASASSSAGMMAVQSPSFYEVLGIPITASFPEIKAAYRKLARRYHPDVAGSSQKEMSANQFIKIQAAYSTLSDPAKRADYDTEVYRSQMHLNLSSRRPASGYSGYYTRKNWESDQFW